MTRKPPLRVNLGKQDIVAEWIGPEEGLLTLSPFCVLHGTETFASDALRMSVAFGAVPALRRSEPANPVSKR